LLIQAESQQRVFLVGLNLRFDPLLQQLEAWLEEQRIGQVASARFHFGSYLPWRHPWEDYRVGYGARSELGGGVILDAIHEIDLSLWLFGMPTWVYCVAGTFSDLEIDVEDIAELVLSYSRHVVSIHLDYVQRPPQRWCEILGTKGQIQGDLVSRTLRLYSENRQWDTYEPPCSADEVYILEMQHFLDCIAGNARPAVNGYVASRSLMAAVAAKESAESGLPVPPDFSSLERMPPEKKA
jgi:predicted dehydrogenase